MRGLESFLLSFFVLLVFLIFSLGVVFSGFSWYDSSTKEGYWWYKDQKKKIEIDTPAKKKKKEEPKEVAKPKMPTENATKDVLSRPLESYTFEELVNMPVKDFQKLFEYYRDLAVSNPTEENIFKFLNLVDVMRKKSLKFASMWSYVVTKYPEFNTWKDYPYVVPGIKARNVEISKEIDFTLEAERGNLGIIFFSKKTCPYCEVQRSILEYLKENRGVIYMEVDIDENYTAAVRFGVDIVPTLLLVDRLTGKYFPLGSGVIAYDDLISRITRGLYVLRGELSPENYYLYKFQKGSSLDPNAPSPLFKKKK